MCQTKVGIQSKLPSRHSFNLRRIYNRLTHIISLSAAFARREAVEIFLVHVKKLLLISVRLESRLNVIEYRLCRVI